jgi:major membrane immunogen (membrane-anchored lipoprotein)
MKRAIFVVMVVAVLLISCGPRAAKSVESVVGIVEPGYQGEGAPVAMERLAPSAPMPTAVNVDYSKGEMAAGQPPSQERLVIQNADLAIVVANPETKMAAIAKMAEQMGGFIVSSNLYEIPIQGGTTTEANVVVRVPALKLEEALARIKSDAVDVQSETRSGQDVTQEYVDQKSRLKNLEAAEAQLTKIMDEATKTEDVLNVFNQLVYYREQIEVVKGQIQYYEQASTLSAISVRLIAEESVKPIELPTWLPQGVANEAVRDLITFTQGFVDFLIRFVLYLLPVLILIGLPIYLIFLGIRAVVRKLRGKKTPPPVKESK